MKGLLDQITTWYEQGRSVALATVIKTWGSSPRPAGAMMAVSDQSEIYGSVSGGCVESAVIDAALAVLRNGTSRRLLFGVANEEAWEVGLSCGGEIEVFVREYTLGDLDRWREAVGQEESFYTILVVDGDTIHAGAEWLVLNNGEVLQSPSTPALPQVLGERTKGSAKTGKTALISLEENQIQEAFLHIVEPPRQLVLVGGVHIAIPLASLAKTLGFEVFVIDPRRLFGTSDRFPIVKELVQEWPQDAFKKIIITGSTAVVMLTHDPKIDDPAIQISLESPAFYIGALGSKKTHQKRLGRLTELGLDPVELRRIHAPVGLDLGAATPEEIAVAILAEIIQTWHQRDEL